MTDLQGDQLAISATSEQQNGKRVYLVWMLVDEDEQAYQGRFATDTPGEAIDAFIALLSKKRLKDFSWRGPAKLTRVK